MNFMSTRFYIFICVGEYENKGARRLPAQLSVSGISAKVLCEYALCI